MTRRFFDVYESFIPLQRCVVEGRFCENED